MQGAAAAVAARSEFVPRRHPLVVASHGLVIQGLDALLLLPFRHGSVLETATLLRAAPNTTVRRCVRTLVRRMDYSRDQCVMRWMCQSCARHSKTRQEERVKWKRCRRDEKRQKWSRQLCGVSSTSFISRGNPLQPTPPTQARPQPEFLGKPKQPCAGDKPR
jgi:hypothetical protein